MTTTLDKEYVHACIHSPRNLSEKWNSNENTEDNLLSCCASIKGKIVPSSGQDQKLKGWTKKLGNALRSSVAAFHQERILTWIKERFPTERRYSERIQRTITVKAQVHLYFVLYSLFYTVSSTLFSFHFPQIVFFLCSVSILWFLLYPKTPFSSVFFFASQQGLNITAAYPTLLTCLAVPIPSTGLYQHVNTTASTKWGVEYYGLMKSSKGYRSYLTPEDISHKSSRLNAYVFKSNITFH